jgi:hypothetical protein
MPPVAALPLLDDDDAPPWPPMAVVPCPPVLLVVPWPPELPPPPEPHAGRSVINHTASHTDRLVIATSSYHAITRRTDAV